MSALTAPIQAPSAHVAAEVPRPVPHVPHWPTPRSSGDADGRERAHTVLIAEDHEDSRDALATLLDAFGYRVLLAGNGAEAVERARAGLPDLILMDMMMPHVDGFAAARELRADERFRGVPIIAITAMEGARRDVLAAGCDDLVVKPVDIRAFLEKVRVWVASGRAATAS